MTSPKNATPSISAAAMIIDRTDVICGFRLACDALHCRSGELTNSKTGANGDKANSKACTKPSQCGRFHNDFNDALRDKGWTSTGACQCASSCSCSAMAMPIKSADKKVKIYACIKAISNSSTLMNSVKPTATGATP